MTVTHLDRSADPYFCNRSQGISDEERQYQGVALGRNS
jgi:hypothetical protein